ncbi:IclR family transcriptional regulator [Paenibacillus rhizovicinus]|uniref:IclR family transcriptional regulator n=1 Tax=Paenibacillus rhizovicinus TaxID=2704463 RepID=A0A6C0P5X8_9BACL|nr:IclR family transcriptional regulator [Paenibacillus rhizovicinus]QHW33919.1 IclR family transcriptional regulator [Paenibacillus rhizovicinus]
MSEQRKYWVPALEKADNVLAVLAAEPARHKLIDLSRRLDINKSSMFSLLNTMETLQWVKRGEGDTYSLGHAFAAYGSSYMKSYDLGRMFQAEASAARDRLQETIQLAKLEGNQVFYLGKVEALSPVRLQSEPGMLLPAHATALGKAMLAELGDDELKRLYPASELPPLTPHSIPTREALFRQLQEIREQGFARDDQESVMGFRCVAAVIRGGEGRTLAAVSCSMLLHQWDAKGEEARTEMLALARRLSVQRS